MEVRYFIPTFEGWKKEARRALAAGIPPGEVQWEEIGTDQPSLSLFEIPGDETARPTHRVPKAFLELARTVALHRDGTRWSLLYRLLFRLTHGEPHLLKILVDDDVRAAQLMEKAVRREIHKMRAFVRFRAVDDWYVAWFEPEHHIVEANAPFFIDRFSSMRWSILTPERCLHWDGKALQVTGGLPKSAAPTDDAVEDLWRTYYGNIFNPARVKEKAMQAEMPKRYWKNLPEATIIPALLSEAPTRTAAMIAKSEGNLVREIDYRLAEPPAGGWDALRQAARACTACPLYRDATQTVFGEGPLQARVVFVGEQPGDSEDRDGEPFVGPAGELLDRAMEEAGIDRQATYVTNAVKHFKWEPRGKRRLHKTPSSRDIASCRPWLLAELNLIRPEILVCLGKTAATSVFEREVKVLQERGAIQRTSHCAQTIVTVHPSALLRAESPEAKEEGYRLFLRDLSVVRELLAGDEREKGA